MPFSEFSKCNLGECSLLPGDESSREREGGGRLPKRVCAAQQRRDFGTLSFTAKLGLSCCGDKNVQKMCVFVDPSHANSYKMHTFIQDCFLLKKNPPEKRGAGN